MCKPRCLLILGFLHVWGVFTRSCMYCYKKHDISLCSRNLLTVKTALVFWQRDDLVLTTYLDLGKYMVF